MSTVTGTANFAQDRFSPSIKPLVAMGIGAVNIFAGILTTIQQFLKISELNEAHRVSSIAWGKFYRNIKVELSKAPHERTNVTQLLKISKEEFDRLMETSPTISEKVIKQFNKTFNNKLSKSKRKETLSALKKPEICDTIESTRASVYKSFRSERRGNDHIVHDIITKYQDEMKRMPTAEEIANETDNEISMVNIQTILKKANDEEDGNNIIRQESLMSLAV